MRPLSVFLFAPQTDIEIPSGVLGTIAIRFASKTTALELHFQLRSSSVDPFRQERESPPYSSGSHFFVNLL